MTTATETDDIIIERVIDAPRDRVWRCWTEPELMKRWFTPAPWQTVHAEVDLRPGGAVITADVTLPELGGIAQAVGIVVQVDSTGRAFRVQGLDLGGTLYAIPNNDIGNLVRNAEAQLNAALAQLVVESSMGRLALDRITVDDALLTVTLR